MQLIGSSGTVKLHLPSESLEKRDQKLYPGRRNLHERLRNKTRSREIREGDAFTIGGRSLGRCPVPVLGSVPVPLLPCALGQADQNPNRCSVQSHNRSSREEPTDR